MVTPEEGEWFQIFPAAPAWAKGSALRRLEKPDGAVSLALR